MQLLSLKTSGKLYFEGVEETFIEELALEIDEDVENVKVTVAYLMSNGLLETGEEDSYILPQTIESIGSETASAERMRKHRAGKAKLSQCDAKPSQSDSLVTKCYTEIDIEKDIEIDIDIELEKESREKGSKPPTPPPIRKHKYGEYKNVLLTESEVSKLTSEYGNKVDEYITFLDEYIEMKGYKAKSHYLAIRKWVVDAVAEREKRSKPKDCLEDSYRMMEEWLEEQNE